MSEKITKITSSRSIITIAGVIFVLALFFRVGVIVTLKLVFSFVAVFFLPGFALGIAIWPRKEEITLLARLISAIALSMVVIPLVIFWLNHSFHVAVSRTNVFVAIFSTTLIFVLVSAVEIKWLKMKEKRTTAGN